MSDLYLAYPRYDPPPHLMLVCKVLLLARGAEEKGGSGLAAGAAERAVCRVLQARYGPVGLGTMGGLLQAAIEEAQEARLAA